MTISQRYQRLLDRRAPHDDRIIAKFAESFERQAGEATRYLLGAMRPVDATYTQRLREQGDRVENQLATRLRAEYPGLAFRRQGSVSNNTHIKYYSDVDVLAIIDRFVTLQRPQVPQIPYAGDPVDDLTELRAACVRELRRAFPMATIDDRGSTAVAISGASLACKVDAVPANWFDSNRYASSGLEHDRGVQVLDKFTRERTANYPFQFNHRIHRFDIDHFGTPRMMMRLLKTVRAELEEEGTQAECSSFDLCSLVYRMPESLLVARPDQPLILIGRLLDWLSMSFSVDELRSNLKVVDDSRVIYRNQSVVSGVILVYRELDATYRAARSELRDVGLITEAHIA